MHETIALLGGSFNPIHNGHLAMAEAALVELSPDRLLIIPDGDPPHKAKGLEDKAHRLRMTELAADGRFEVSSMEVERPGKTYTVDTLEALHAAHPGVRLIMLIGADTLRELPTWHDAQRVFSLCEFAVFTRDGLALTAMPGINWFQMAAQAPDISSTEIRARVHKGQSLEGYTPQAVEDYIGVHRLYNPPVQMSKKAIKKRLKDTLPNGRYKHTLGTEETICALAARWDANAKQASLAALLHDCAKGMSLEAMQKFVDKQGVRVDPISRKTIALLHAPAGMAMARAVYGVTDPEILRAIRHHNTGASPMGLLDKLLFLADMIEPGRKVYPWMQALREMCMIDLDRAVLMALEQQWEHIQARGGVVHPDTAAALETMKKNMEREENA